MQLVLDTGGVIARVDTAGAIPLRVPANRLLGVPLRQLIAVEDRPLFADHLHRTQWGSDSTQTDLRMHTRDGGRLPVRLYSKAFQERRRTFVSTVGIDLTEQRFIEEARQSAERQREAAERAREAARASDASKDRLLAIVSHELRNPLSPASIAAEGLAARTDLPDEARRLAEIVRRNIQAEARLIEDLLDFARVTRGALAVRHERVDVHRALDDAIASCEVFARTRQIKIRKRLQAPHPVVTGDPSRLSQVFWNLLNNAIKFSEPGGEVVVRSIGDARQIRVAIRDHGAGMSRETMESLFSPTREASSAPGERGGLGLGLAIAKGIVDAHVGRIRAASDGYGLGSTFEVELGIATPGTRVDEPSPAPRRSAPQRAPARRTLRILVVEDHPDAGDMLAGYLRSRGHEVRLARTKAEAESLLAQRWDVLVCDIHLGEHANGHEIARHARAGLNAHARLVALSGFGAEADAEASREAGFDVHLVKPVDLETLRSLVEGSPDASGGTHPR